MLAPYEQNIIQIDITNACPNTCANCTRMCGSHVKPYFMDLPTFKRCVDSVVDYPGGMVGIMGGEPTLHPQFRELMTYYRSVIHPEIQGPTPRALGPIDDFGRYRNETSNCHPPSHRGLFTSLGKSYYKHFELIQEVFPDYQCLNDHAHPGKHQPLLIASEELPIPEDVKARLIDNCWINRTWSASMTPKGGFFCEVAGALDMLFNGPGGVPIEPGWWKRRPEEFGNQLDWCKLCGAAMPLPRRQANSEVDDVSPGMLERLKAVNSPKARVGKYRVFDVAKYRMEDYTGDWKPTAEWYLADEKDNGRRVNTIESLRPQRVDCVITSIDYHDYLNVTLPRNRIHFDRIIVATIPEDAETQAICRRYGVECCLCPEMRQPGVPIRKGRGINQALEQLASRVNPNGTARTTLDWVLHTDADILLPNGFRRELDRLVLNPAAFYYSQRLEPTPDTTDSFLRDLNTRMRTYSGRMIAINRPRPDGFFQLFHVRSSTLSQHDTLYDESSPNAEYSDSRFAGRWPHHRQIAIQKRTGLLVHMPHRVNENAGYGHPNNFRANWNGRVTDYMQGIHYQPAIPISDGEWTVFFVGDNPELWGTGIFVGKQQWGAILPEYLRRVRMRRMDTGESIEFELDGNPAREVELADGRRWTGNLWHCYNGFHLGLTRAETVPLVQEHRGTVILEKQRELEYTGWGFGHRMYIDDAQGYAWDGEAIEQVTFEIAGIP